MTAAEYLASEPVGNADLLEMLRRGTADVLYCTQHALAMHERVSGAAVLCAETEREARAALEHLPRTGLYVAHGALCAGLLREGNRLYRRTKVPSGTVFAACAARARAGRGTAHSG